MDGFILSRYCFASRCLCAGNKHIVCFLKLLQCSAFFDLFKQKWPSPSKCQSFFLSACCDAWIFSDSQMSLLIFALNSQQDCRVDCPTHLATTWAFDWNLWFGWFHGEILHVVSYCHIVAVPWNNAYSKKRQVLVLRNWRPWLWTQHPYHQPFFKCSVMRCWGAHWKCDS